MTDFTISLIVTLDKEYRTDNVEVIVDAIKMIKGVLNVDVNNFGSHERMNKWATKQQLKTEFLNILAEAFDRF